MMTPLQPWEATGPVPAKVLYDSQRELFRMWYHVDDESIGEERRRLTGENIGAPQKSYICYVESRDGVNWERPDLHIYDENGGRNNICFKGFSRAVSATILHQPEASGDEQYLLFTCDWFSMTSGGVAIACSADGIHWKYPEEKPAVYGHSDTTNSVVYNPERGVYMLYMRAWHAAAVGWVEPRNTRRRVAYSESADLKEWSEPQIIVAPDELDTDDLYGMVVFRHGNYYLGQLQIYDQDGSEKVDIELAWSTDGFHWSRLPHRPKFIPTGEAGDPDGFMVFTSQSPVIIGDEMFLYWAGYDEPHNSQERSHRNSVHLLRGKLRLDGFVSLTAGNQLGALITRPFTLQSDSISINASTHSGEIVAELVEPFHGKDGGEPAGKPIEGFRAEDFDIIRGDSTSHKLSWRGSSDLSTLKGRRLMLRMSLRYAELYSFTI